MNSPFAGSDSTEPIRSELFSVERLEQHAESLAFAQTITTTPASGRQIIPRLRDNGRVLLKVYRAIGDAIREERAISPAAEWLVDNFHVVEDQIREIKDDLPRGFYRQLPKLAGGPLKGYPRVFGVTWAYVAHTDSRCDPETLRRFLQAYQRVQPLTIGELWAVAITLRVLLVENMRRVADRIVGGRQERQEADAIADRLVGADGHISGDALRVLARFDKTSLPPTMAVQLIQRLRDQDPAVTPALRWLEGRLAAQGKSTGEIVREEHQRQGAMSVTVRNVVGSMRLISAVDWAEFFESVSLIDTLLGSHTAFGEMDFQTRDQYRHAIEELAKASGRSELDIAGESIRMARKAFESSYPVDPRRSDPGYYLVSGGRPEFERAIGFRSPLRTRINRAVTDAGVEGYLSAITLVVVFILLVPLLGVAETGTGGVALFLLAFLALFPLSDVAVALVNRWVTTRFAPRALPAMELRNGVPADMRTMVVVPILLTSLREIEERIDRLEVHYLSSQDGELFFALLSDWADSTSEHGPDDDALLSAARNGIARLNQRHSPDRARFFIFHRRRLWNKGEGKWIGWERKRGKLHELNRLLRGATDTSFLGHESDLPSIPSNVRYVITLDADTQLPRGVAKRLVGKMAHPLNLPQFDPQSGRVINGYAVLQPRVTPALPNRHTGSFFQQLFSGPAGMDPYAFTVSDVYQDLFGEGSYTGKGIYDIDGFEAALKGKIPENAVLSHDLLEGVFARAGLASDIEVVEEFPSRYDVAAGRQHRWARGDWQLLPWAIGGRSTVPLIGRWKMLDNLRRTLSAPAAFLALTGGWILPFTSAVTWSGFILLTIALPAFLPFLDGLMPRRVGISKRGHFRAVKGDLSLALSQAGFLVTMLAHQAWTMTDAIVRVLFRLLISRRMLLEWVTAAQMQVSNTFTFKRSYSTLIGGVVLATIAAGLVTFAGNGYQPVAVPFIVLWMLSPVVAWWVSLPAALVAPEPLPVEDDTYLRIVARRTWRFFETFVAAHHHMLPPDNFQEEPRPVVAHRTSPTNIGLYLLSVVTARDFGWLNLIDTTERLDATLGTLHKLERFRGHLYNWYDTLDLRPLDPKYVSSVDSGNLAGHLIALGNACREMIVSPVIGKECRPGILDAVEITRESLKSLSENRRTQTVTLLHVEESLDALSASLLSMPGTPSAVFFWLSRLATEAETLTDTARALIEERGDGTPGSADIDLLIWSGVVRTTIQGHVRDMETLMPWAKVIHDGSNQLPEKILDILDTPRTLADLPGQCERVLSLLNSYRNEPGNQHSPVFVDSLVTALRHSAESAHAFERRLSVLAERANSLWTEMEFGFLFDQQRQLLSIGYRPADGTLDPNCYDLLGSEACLASFVAIAKGDIPVRHWFRLGRALTPVDRGSALISWSGSMFEYLMPSLVMKTPPESLLDHTNRLVVRRQIAYGKELGIPWGISESAYNVRDFEFTYQYSNFGVPGLGLKRGLSEDAVVAPYATGLAAMVEPGMAVLNFRDLVRAGALGRYGFYEALDYTPARLPEDEEVAIIRAHMAHHQGMTLVAIANVLHGGSIRACFHAEPLIKATELLLQERTPRDIPAVRPRAEEVNVTTNVRELISPTLRQFHSPHTAIPRTHLLSNGKYAVMLTAAGSGYSRWRDLAITRWREDTTCDGWGSYIYLRNMRTGKVWSAGYQPRVLQPDAYDVMFSEDRAEIVRRDGRVTTMLEVTVSPEDDAEVRRVSISNHGRKDLDVEVTSYAEIVLATPMADMAHPAFSKLFVQTGFLPDLGSIIATRRKRSPNEPELWAAHVSVVEGTVIGELEYETDRARFLGRGRDVRSPISVMDGRPLSNTAGAVLDPVFSIRRQIRIAPGHTAHIAFWTLIAPSRQEIIDQVDKHHDPAAFERAGTLAWTQAQVQLHHLGVAPDEAHVFQRLLNHVLYANQSLRSPSGVALQNELGPSALWAHGISGDLPIVLVRIDEEEDLEIIRQLLRAHEYWRMKGVATDLVILNEQAPSYTHGLHALLETTLRANESRLRPQVAGSAASKGSVFLLRSDLVPVEVRILIRTVARAVLLSRSGSLSEQIQRAEESHQFPTLRPGPVAGDDIHYARSTEPATAPHPNPPEFFNGLGGFASDGHEYLIQLNEHQWTPAPWINVIANPSFGFQVSVEGSGYTWSLNSRQNQLTPWSNDPVCDQPGEVLYLRDEESGEVWTPTALPIRESGQYRARHGQGYSRFELVSRGFLVDLLQFVPTDDTIKISRLTIRNNSGRSRRLSVTAYVEWVLGTSRAASAPCIVTEIDAETGALLARNAWRSEFGQRIAFVDLANRQSSWTGDRTEFIGRNGSLAHPAALMTSTPLRKRAGVGLDPCGVLQTVVDLAPNERKEVVAFLGEAGSRAEARSLLGKYRTADIDAVFRAVTKMWNDTLGVVQVKTPDRSLDILLNRWTLYQTLACRVWARSAFYQASGAYGFRDQIQDQMALILTRPDLTRAHLLRAAGRQFVEGDMQHWWFPSSGQGVRTRVSDDRAWLPFAVAHYVETTGDDAVLEETVQYLQGRLLGQDEHDAFFQPNISEESGSLYDHCALALDCSLETGNHGLPLFGTGDWNDGMNRVGEEGKGESVWLGWFLHATLSAFIPLAGQRGDHRHARVWQQHATTLQKALEQEAWDGRWYRRGYFDDGTPLGSDSNNECKIDSIAQSWGVISGAADPDRITRAMNAVDQYLVRRDEGLVLLFTPPFNQSMPDPGYVKGYPPGIRENGGQYTHAALWSVMAFALLGDGDKAMELLSMLNPINHSKTRAGVRRYKVEPYAMCADVYGAPPHVGRGGWTWYTGSAGWLYRAGIESVLGFRVKGKTLVLDPCIPKSWKGFELIFRYRSTTYEIRVENPGQVNRGIASVRIDGVVQTAHTQRHPAGITLTDDGATHKVEVVLGTGAAT